ncbi:MAG: Cyclohexadienyl dehydrogenase(EC, partial [uncultured Rubellimicrobium sp.]
DLRTGGPDRAGADRVLHGPCHAARGSGWGDHGLCPLRRDAGRRARD